jgi:hypothetical protein
MTFVCNSLDSISGVLVRNAGQGQASGLRDDSIAMRCKTAALPEVLQLHACGGLGDEGDALHRRKGAFAPCIQADAWPQPCTGKK